MGLIWRWQDLGKHLRKLSHDKGILVLQSFAFEKAVEASSLEVFIKQTNLLQEYFGHCFGEGGGMHASEGSFPGNNEEFFFFFGDVVNLGNL